VEKTILLASSMHSRTLLSPSGINFEMVRQLAEPNQFNRQSQPVGLLLEGVFTSAFENRVSESLASTLAQTGNSYKSTSIPTRMLVYSDGDLVNNAVSSRGEPGPLGFNIYEQKTYPANKDLILNSIEYLLDEHQIMAARNKEIRLRLLDAAQVRDHAGYWRWFNLLVPVLVIMLLNLAVYYWRKWRYA
jgi:ABC-2 type transport system permease protein